MDEKKDILQVINNIQELNLEIDYDKLAEAMVKAQEKTKQQTGNSPADTKMTAGFFAFIAKVFFHGAGWMIAVLSVLFLPVTWIAGIRALNWQGVSNFVLSGFVLLVATSVLVVLFLISSMMIGAAKEVKQFRDTSFAISVCSSLTGLVALIIAIVALFNGVG